MTYGEHVVVTTSDGDGHLVEGTVDEVIMKIGHNKFLKAVDACGTHYVHCPQVTGVHDATDDVVEGFLGL